MAVTGLADPDRLLRIDAGRPGLPLSLTKPIGSGVLNSRHKATGEVFPAAIDVMTTLNDAASRQALAAGIRCATDVTGFGLLGHLFKLARASGVTAVLDERGGAADRGRGRYGPGRLRSRRQPAEPGLGGAAQRFRRRDRGACCSCWPTLRRLADCYSSARFQARQ